MKYTIGLALTVLVLFIFNRVNIDNSIEGDMNREGVEIVLYVHTFSNKNHLEAATQKYGTTHQSGLAVWSNNDNRCDVYVIKGKDNLETWGHELAHCVYGKFHEE